MVAPSSAIYGKIWVGFCLNTGKRFVLKLEKVLLKKGARDFQNSPPFGRSACFCVTITENFERFQYFNFETDFLENENLFQKTGLPFFSWKH